MAKYYVSEWALRRKAEIVDLPDDFPIHEGYLKELPKERIVPALQSVHQIMRDIFQDIADHPEAFKMPLVEIREDTRTKYGFPPPDAQTSKRAPYMLPDALINLLISGEMVHDEVRIDVQRLLYANKNHKMSTYQGYSPKSYTIKNISCLYGQLSSYGFYLEGMKSFKPADTTAGIILRYPNSADVLTVLKWMADKAHEHDRRQDFMICHYRLLQDDMKSLNYGIGVDYIADRVHTRQEKDCAYQFDAALRDSGLSPRVDNRAEPAGEDAYAVYYYAKERDVGNRSKSNCKLSSRQTKLYASFRFKRIKNCAEHIMNCSDVLKALFIPGDKGCPNRPTCKHGQSYCIDGKEYWKCGCCGSMITFQPRSEDIADYLRLLHLGNDRV